MGFDLGVFEDKELGVDFVEWLVDEQSLNIQSHFSKLWEYYANRLININAINGSVKKINESGRCYIQAQEYGLPSRITGMVHSSNIGVFGGQSIKEIQRKEVVIENDIGWRVNAAVDFLFGKPISFVCKSPDSQKSAEIEKLLKALFSANGGIGFFQDMAVLGSVYGFVDCLVRPGNELMERFTHSSSFDISFEEVLHLAQTIDLELIEAPRALPILENGDYRKIRYYIQHFHQKKNSLKSKGSFLSRLKLSGVNSFDDREVIAVTEIISSNVNKSRSPVVRSGGVIKNAVLLVFQFKSGEVL